MRKKNRNSDCPGCGHSIKLDHSSAGCVHINDEGAFTCHCNLSADELKQFREFQRSLQK